VLGRLPRGTQRFVTAWKYLEPNIPDPLEAIVKLTEMFFQIEKGPFTLTIIEKENSHCCFSPCQVISDFDISCQGKSELQANQSSAIFSDLQRSSAN
jgi:hypothetical protein